MIGICRPYFSSRPQGLDPPSTKYSPPPIISVSIPLVTLSSSSKKIISLTPQQFLPARFPFSPSPRPCGSRSQASTARASLASTSGPITSGGSIPINTTRSDGKSSALTPQCTWARRWRLNAWLTMVRRAGQCLVWRQKVVREWRMFWWESRARSSRRMRG